MTNWIRKPSKAARKISSIWKAVISTFPIIGDRLVWKVGSGANVRLGIDPWVGNSEGHILPQMIIHSLHDKEIYRLKNIIISNYNEQWSQEWKDASH